jgi:hypothetical protein
MNPEATTHRISAHANTDCGTCHIGPGVLPMVRAKLENVRYLWIYPFNLYERPIPSPISTLRPAEATCEQCHWPAMFYPISLVTHYNYAQDRENSLTRVQLPLKVGSGREDPVGRGPGIHWHIRNVVRYYPADEQRQEIPWVQAQVDGQVKTYVSSEIKESELEIDEAEVREMDCIDCHNRATHIVRHPGDAVDEAMSNGDLPSDLPFLKQQAMAVLEERYDDDAQAREALDGIVDYYRQEHPDLYAEQQQRIQSAVERLWQIYNATHFPYMNVYWFTYPNNIGHDEFPGCWRCHDGKHITQDDEAIRLECNLCHAIPQVVEPGQPLPDISLAVRQVPPSHESTLWMAQHRFQFDESCAACHTIVDPGGASNAGFCSNSACHGRSWQFAGLNAPQIRELVAPPELPGEQGLLPIPHPITPDTDCSRCHGLEAVLPFPENHVDFGQDQCTDCHAPSIPLASPTPEASPTAPATATPEASPTVEAAASPTAPATATPQVSPTTGASPTPAATATPTPAPEETPSASPEATRAPGSAPSIPHETTGAYEQCLTCHAEGAAGAPAIPADHEPYTNQQCTACHQP